MFERTDDIDRIADGLWRFGQVIGAASNSAAGEVGLSQLQLGILTLLARRDQGETVGFFARYFMISAATVSDSIRVMEAKGLVTKSRETHDARSVRITITAEGRESVTRSSTALERLRRIVAGWDERKRSEILPAIIALIDGLQKQGAIPADRMCVACRYFAINCDPETPEAAYYCRLIDAPLRAIDLRVDCPEFELQPQP